MDTTVAAWETPNDRGVLSLEKDEQGDIKVTLISRSGTIEQPVLIDEHEALKIRNTIERTIAVNDIFGVRSAWNDPHGEYLIDTEIVTPVSGVVFRTVTEPGDEYAASNYFNGRIFSIYFDMTTGDTTKHVARMAWLTRDELRAIGEAFAEASGFAELLYELQHLTETS